MDAAVWLLFFVPFCIGILLDFFKKSPLIKSLLCGFSGGVLISIVCFRLPAQAGNAPAVYAALMLLGVIIASRFPESSFLSCGVLFGCVALNLLSPQSPLAPICAGILLLFASNLVLPQTGERQPQKTANLGGLAGYLVCSAVLFL